MRKFFISIVLLSAFSIVPAQNREEVLQKYRALRQQVTAQEEIILAPSAEDSKAAAKEGLSVFRLMPRETYDGKLTIRGGGAYYTFTKKIQEYNYGSDIGLERGNLSVGFAGADYGFIYDLGETSLESILKESEPVMFLSDYKPPANEPEIRVEQRKAYEYQANGFTYRSRVPSVIGHSYVLRSINFDSWDVLVALKVHRKDTDGSLIIFWKFLKEFEKPAIARNQ
jgi:hypothetical protein